MKEIKTAVNIQSTMASVKITIPVFLFSHMGNAVHFSKVAKKNNNYLMLIFAIQNKKGANLG